MNDVATYNVMQSVVFMTYIFRNLYKHDGMSKTKKIF